MRKIFKGIWLQKPWLVSLLIFGIVGFCLYGTGLTNPFIADDTQQIVANPLLASLTNIPTFFQSSTFFSGGTTLSGVYYKPITVTVFSLLITYFGYNSFAFHLVQLFLHIANTTLLFLLFRKFFKSQIAFILASLFLIHPINSESVVYISALQEVLFFFFGAAAFFLITTNLHKRSTSMAALLLLLSLLAKETGVLFLGISLLYVWVYKRTYLRSFIIISAGVSVLYSVLRIHAIGLLSNPGISPINHLSLLERMAMIPQLVFWYISKMFLPVQLSSSYRMAYAELTRDHFWIPLFIDVLIAAAFVFIGFLLYKKKQLQSYVSYIFFAIWLIIGIGLLVHFIPLDVTLAERWFYFPLVGLLGILGVILTTIPFSLKNHRNKLLLLLLISLFSVRTSLRIGDWRDYFTLARTDIVVTPESYDLEDVIGITYLQAGKLTEAQQHLERSIRLYPNFQNYNNLGLWYFATNNYTEAEKAFRISLTYQETYQATENIAVVSLLSKTPEEAHGVATEALTKFPANAKLWLVLALSSYKLNRYEEAVAAIKKAYAFNPSPEVSNYYTDIMNKKPIELKGK